MLPNDWQNRLATRDRYRLTTQAKRLGTSLDEAKQLALTQAIESSIKWVESRHACLPRDIEFDPALPVNGRIEAIADTIAQNQVTIIAGATGSGKTTQIPKICLRLGLGTKGLIGHTQPRRIAARTVADRISSELKVSLGNEVGYQIRFNDNSNEKTFIKLMTDGILLAELAHDKYLSRYEVIIIDEAHERSLNIDFLLGYLKLILPKRPDLKVIITSATIDVERFSKHFNRAPVIEVSGRTYPVDIRYRPVLDDAMAESMTDAIVQAVEEILAEPLNRQAPDILIFLSGERDIRELAKCLTEASLSHCDVLPLYARLSIKDQNKVFTAHKGRRIVLSTNVAETSLTVPGIGYVIDPGVARISRYSVRSKIQRLPIEPISQASANQRAGRCGRISEGVCIRLYSEEDFLSRPEFTDPEMLRTNLAAVILQMSELKFGAIEQFPFIDPPDGRLIRDGYQLLDELQAIKKNKQPSALGRSMAKLPLDPRLAKIIITAQRYGCVAEALIIASALSIQDPRERPANKQQAADQQHQLFHDKQSDFLAFVNLWYAADQVRKDQSNSQFKQWCKQHYLSERRMREWRDVHSQLIISLKPLKYSLNEDPASYQAIHTAIVSGLLSYIACKDDDGSYFATRNRKLMIFPGSSQYKRKPRFIVAGNILETSQVFAHTVAGIEREWVVSEAKHLIKRHAFEPYYHAHTGQIRGFERLSLYGLTLVDKSPVNFAERDPELARHVFIRSALAEGQYAKAKSVKASIAKVNKDTHFFLHLQSLIQSLETLEAKSRRRDILVDEDAIFLFFLDKIPADVVDLASFERWRAKAELADPKYLFISSDSLTLRDTDHIQEAQFPDQLKLGDTTFGLSYFFEPKHPADGVSIHVPVTALHNLPKYQLDWLIPGLLHEKCVALVKLLPKSIRKQLVPVPDLISRALTQLTPTNRPLTECLAKYIERYKQITIEPNDWTTDLLDDYYRFNIKVIDDSGRELDQSRDLSELIERYKATLQQTISEHTNEVEQQGLTSWSFSTLPKTYELKKTGIAVTTYPALVDQNDQVDIVLCDNAQDAHEHTLKGTVRLAKLALGVSVKTDVLKGRDLGLAMVSIGDRKKVTDDLVMSAIRHVCFSAHERPLPSNQADFNAAIANQHDAIVALINVMADRLVNQLKAVTSIKKTIKTAKNALAIATCANDINEQLSLLYFPGYLYLTPHEWLDHYDRYLQAISYRLEKAPIQIHKDRASMAEIAPFVGRIKHRLTKTPESLLFDPTFCKLRFMCEELRVSLFAQPLGTALPVSVKRINKWLKEQGE